MAAALPGRVAVWLRLVAGPFPQVGVGAEEDRQVVGLRRRLEAERPPGAGDAVAGLAPEHPLGPEVHRGEGDELEHEQAAEVARRGRLPEAEQCGQAAALGGRGLRQAAEGAEELHRSGGPQPASLRSSLEPGRAKAERTGLTGRISQCGRRVPSGEWSRAERVFASQASKTWRERSVSTWMSP